MTESRCYHGCLPGDCIICGNLSLTNSDPVTGKPYYQTGSPFPLSKQPTAELYQFDVHCFAPTSYNPDKCRVCGDYVTFALHLRSGEIEVMARKRVFDDFARHCTVPSVTELERLTLKRMSANASARERALLAIIDKYLGGAR